MNGSISLLRANTALTTNVKLVVDTQYNLYLESYSANLELSDKKFKKFLITADSFISQRIANFYQGLPTDLAFHVKNDINSDIIQTDYNNQIDDIYYSGARNVEDTRYVEEFQYNTTLKINPTKLPKYFMIFRVDGPGTKEVINENDVAPIDNYEYTHDYIHSTKLITVVDLTSQTNVGKLWKKNYIDDELLLRSPVELNFKKYEFSKWNGYDYYTGGIVSKSFIMNDFMQNQTTPFDFESFITDGFKSNAVVSSHYSNISYLFDDTVSGVFYKSITPGQFKYFEKDYPFITKYIQEGSIDKTQVNKFIEQSNSLVYYTFSEDVPYRRKWTINRYTGFYIDDIIPSNIVSAYSPVDFKIDKGIYLVDNVFRVSNSQSALSINPVKGVYDSQFPVYFKIGKELFLVELHNNDYVLISNTIFNGLIDTFVTESQPPITIVYEDDGFGVFRSYIKNIDNTYFLDVNLFYNRESIYVIKIVDDYYRLKTDALNHIYIHTDEYIICDSTKIYRKLGFNNIKFSNIQLLTKDNTITYFEIFQLQFTQISDWNFDRENTQYADIEYNKNNTVNYKRPFLYSLNVQDTNFPIDPYREKYYNIWINSNMGSPLFSNTFILPLSSEYAASGDLYMLNNLNTLTKIWDINQSSVKWGIYQSVNNMSYPYSINNSLDVCGQYNFTPNIYSSYVDLHNMTLDWFYSLGFPLNYDLNTAPAFNIFTSQQILNTTERTLNIELPLVSTQNPNPQLYKGYYKFDIDYYKNVTASIDYFDYIFNLSVVTAGGNGPNNEIHYNRISYFTESDSVNGPSVFFKGLAAYVQYANTINPNVNEKFTITPADDIAGYGFSILYSPRYTDSQNLLGKAGIEVILNKIYKNLLINIYVYTLPGTYTSLDYRERDSVYDEKYVSYTNWDDPSLQTAYVFRQSELLTEALTLKTMIDILNNNRLTHPQYSQGIKYIVVDNHEEFKITSMTSAFNGTDTLVTITFDKNITLQHGDWIFLQNTGYALFDTNLQIITKNDNRNIVISVAGDQTIPVSLMTIATVVCTNEQSVYPFRLNIIFPDEIKLNKSANLIIGDTTCPVKPRNSFIINTDILVSVNDFVNNIPNVYVDDNISRRIQKTNTNKELSYNEIDNLPAIYRHGGDYEPILENIDLFSNSVLTSYNSNYSASTVHYIDFEQINNKYYLSVHITDIFYQLDVHPYFDVTNVAVGDIVYIGDYLNNIQTQPWIDFKNNVEFKTCKIIALEPSTIIATGPGPFFYKSFKVTLSLELSSIPVMTNYINLSAPVLPAVQPPNGDTVSVYLFKYNKTNTSFYYYYTNFGKLKELTIAKTYEGINPLQTSNDTWKTTNKYPMIDEHGVTTISRNLFKSSWDPKFYYKTSSNKYLLKV